MEETIYRRPLPADTIAFSSTEGRQIFAEALAAGGLDGYFPLAEQFHTQSEPAFCGLGSLVVALNALAIDPGRLWKGPWRWFGEELLDCCVPLSEVQKRGLSLDELAFLARCNGVDVDVTRANDANLDAWRDALAVSSRGSAVLLASYDRASVGQTGSGHWSPIGGHHPERDLLLVLDVARFKYPPHWLPAETFWRAMQPVDLATGRARGWMLLRPRTRGVALGFTLKCDGESWESVAEHVASASTALASAGDVASMARAVAPLTKYLEVRTPSAAAHREALATARAELEQAAIYGRIEEAVGADEAEAATLLILAAAEPSTPERRALLDVGSAARPDSALATELTNLRAQLGAFRAHTRDAPRCGPSLNRD